MDWQLTLSGVGVVSTWEPPDWGAHEQDDSQYAVPIHHDEWKEDNNIVKLLDAHNELAVNIIGGWEAHGSRPTGERMNRMIHNMRYQYITTIDKY
jgi:hypothetical protein